MSESEDLWAESDAKIEHYDVIDVLSGTVLTSCDSFDDAMRVVTDSTKFPHAWKDIRADGPVGRVHLDQAGNSL